MFKDGAGDGFQLSLEYQSWMDHVHLSRPTPCQQQCERPNDSWWHASWPQKLTETQLVWMDSRMGWISKKKSPSSWQNMVDTWFIVDNVDKKNIHHWPHWPPWIDLYLWHLDWLVRSLSGVPVEMFSQTDFQGYPPDSLQQTLTCWFFVLEQE